MGQQYYDGKAAWGMVVIAKRYGVSEGNANDRANYRHGRVVIITDTEKMHLSVWIRNLPVSTYTKLTV